MTPKFEIDDLVKFKGEGRRKTFVVKWVYNFIDRNRPDMKPVPMLKIRTWKDGKETDYTQAVEQADMEKVGVKK